MAKFVFNICCCCIELPTGCLIIGYLNFIWSLNIIAFSISGTIENPAWWQWQPTPPIWIKIAQQAIEGVQMEMKILARVVILLIGLFGFAMSIVLLVGVDKKKRHYLKVYLIGTAVLLVIHLILIIVTAALDINRHKAAAVAIYAVYNLVAILLSIYFLMVIRSYYYKIDEEEQP